MPRQFTAREGADYPATLADFKRAAAGDLANVTWARVEAGETIAAPYPEIIPSWLANGFREAKAKGVKSHGIQER
jgi:hypothetical protein